MQAFLYFTKAFKDFTPHVIGAMRLVANSYDPEELNLIGMGLYVSGFLLLVLNQLILRTSSNQMSSSGVKKEFYNAPGS
jgi:hypothetical protein